VLTQNQRSDLRDRILEAAEQIVREKGAANATTREIARAAGCAEGSIYVHFQNKEELLVALVIERRPEFPRLLELPGFAGTATVRENLEEFLTQLVTLLEEALPLITSLLGDPALLARHTGLLRERQAGSYEVLEALRAYLRAERRGGRIDTSVDPAFSAGLLLAACRGFVLSTRVLGDVEPSSARRFARRLVHALLPGLEPAGASRRGVT
jgi:AcrR family transcriptional regulator